MNNSTDNSGSIHGTWHQPEVAEKKVDESVESKKEEASVIEFVYDENAPSLMMLNDDCLLYLLKFFNVLEIIKIRGVCIRLDTLIDIHCRKFVNFDFKDFYADITLMNARDILTFLGPNMKSLKINENAFECANCIIGWIASYCKNLENLELTFFDPDYLEIKKLKLVIQNLKSLRIGGCSPMAEDDLGICFQCTTQLEELTISAIEISGKCLTKLSNLKILNVNYCKNLQSEPFKETLLKNKTLKKLGIRGCSKLDNSVVNCIVSDVQEIEALSLGDFYPFMSNYSHFADLPHLKKLFVKLFESGESVDALLEKLGEKNILQELDIEFTPVSVKETIKHISKITNLRTLSMKFISQMTDDDFKMLQNLTQLTSVSIPFAERVTANGVLALLNACKEIKFLNVSFSGLDIKFLEKVIHMWKQSVNRPKLELILFETEIDSKSEKVQKLLNENRDKIKLRFGAFFLQSIN